VCSERITRYPGAQPFPDDDLWRKLFFGREQESITLANQILAHRLVVLFARSGLGKTSLLNAGVAEKLRAQGHIPLTVRVNDIERGPLQSTYSGIAAASERQGVEYAPGDTASLWRFFKTAQFWREDVLLTPVLVLDQFEELFTLQSEEQRGRFIDQLSYLVRGVRPAELQKEPIGASPKHDPSTPAVDDSPPAVKIVLSLREDFLAELEELSARIPDVLDERFRLVPLTRAAALRALQEPAHVEDPNLVTNPFELESLAIEKILDFLDRRTLTSSPRLSSIIEPFQLQLICQRLEEIADSKQRAAAHEKVSVTLGNIGGENRLRQIMKDFYAQQVRAVQLRQRNGVRRLCSEFLISPQGRRLRMEESEISRVCGVHNNTLKTLVGKRLFRVDETDNGTYYELSHDSLIKPIMMSRRLSGIAKLAWYIGLVILSFAVLLGTVGLIGYIFLYNYFAKIKVKMFEGPADYIVIVSLFLLAWFAFRWAYSKSRETMFLFRRLRI